MFFDFALQLFADGASAGDGGDGASAAQGTGVTPQAAAGDQEARLIALGVPKEKIRLPRDRANKAAAPAAKPAENSAAKPAAAAAQAAAAEEGSQSKKPSWEEILKDPDYNRQMQAVVQARLKESKAAQDQLQQLSPALQMIAKKYGIEASEDGKLDMAALSEAVQNDDSYWDDKAEELGTSPEIARRLVDAEQKAKMYDQMQTQTAEQRRMQAHLEGLHAQEAAMQQKFPGFSLETELNNPTFVRLTAPGSGLSVEDAFFAVHRTELQQAAAQNAAKAAAEQITSSIQRKAARPAENGATAQAASTMSIDMNSKSYRDYIKQQMMEAKRHGTKFYPPGVR